MRVSTAAGRPPAGRLALHRWLVKVKRRATRSDAHGCHVSAQRRGQLRAFPPETPLGMAARPVALA